MWKKLIQPTAARERTRREQRLFLLFRSNTIYSFLLIAVQTYISNELIWLTNFLKFQEVIILGLFVLEYVMRIRLAKNKRLYMHSFFGIIDLFACIPILQLFLPNTALFGSVTAGLQVLSATRILKFIRFILANKDALPTKIPQQILQVLRQQQRLLLQILSIILSLAMTRAVLVYLVEHPVQPDKFANIFDAFWWAFITFTTVGYGDLYPITTFGRIIAMLLSLLGIAVFSIPTTIISSTLISRIHLQRNQQVQKPQTLQQQLHDLQQTYEQKLLSESEYQQLRNRVLAQYGLIKGDKSN